MVKFTANVLREFIIYILAITALVFLGLFAMSNRYNFYIHLDEGQVPFTRFNNFTGEVCGYVSQEKKWICLPTTERKLIVDNKSAE